MRAGGCFFHYNEPINSNQKIVVSKLDLTYHKLILIQARFLKLTVMEAPYRQPPYISGLRIFGRGDGEKPEIPEFEVCRGNDLDMMVKIKGTDAVGYNIL